MTAVLAVRAPAPVETARRTGAPTWVWVACCGAIAVLAFLVRYGLLARGGGLIGSDGYDDGVYYAAADAFVHGRLPYRDFLFLQPPGILLGIAPFAWIGSITSDAFGMALARLAFMAIGAVNAVLVAVLGRRFGRTAGVVAGVTYAVLYPAVYAERSSLLEPLGTLGVLIALTLARRAGAGRLGLLLAGVAAGCAVGAKIWYVVPLAILLAFQRRGRLRLTVGAAIGGAALFLPFLLVAPVPMFREVVLDQLGRPRSGKPTLIGRIASIVGAPSAPLHGALAGFTPHRMGAVLFLVALGFAILACTVRGARIYPALAAAGFVVLIASPSYFGHYGALVAPPLAITVGIGTGRLVAFLPPRRLLRLGVAGLVVLAVLAVNRHNDLGKAGTVVPAAALRPAAAHVSGCITTDDPVLLADLNVLSKDLARNCPLWPDVTGYTYDRDSVRVDGHVLPRARNDRWQRDVVTYLESGAAVIRDRGSTGLDADSRSSLNRGRVLAHSGHFVLRSVPH